MYLASNEHAARAHDILNEADHVRELGVELSREIEKLRRDLEAAIASGCTYPQDRSLCATINPSDLAIKLTIEQVRNYKIKL